VGEGRGVGWGIRSCRGRWGFAHAGELICVGRGETWSLSIYIHRVTDALLGGRGLDLNVRPGAIAARLKTHEVLSQLSLHRHQRQAIERRLSDVLVGAVEQGLDHDTHAADAHQVGVVAGVGGRGQVMQQGRVLVGTLAPEDTDLRLGERVELRREGIPDLGHADLLVGQSACSVKLGQEAGDEASTVVDVVLSIGSGQEAEALGLERVYFPCSSTYLRYVCYAQTPSMKRAALYMRVSTLDQHPETQLYDLRQMAQQRGYQIVEEYTDRISGAKAKRPGLDAMMSDGRRGRFDVVLVWASDRIARSVKHFLDVLDELNRLNIEFISFREQIDTGGPLGRAVVVIIGAIAELERNLIIERVRAGMRRAKLEGRHIGRKPLVLDRGAILRDRQRGHSLSQLAKSHLVSRATIHRVLKEHATTILEKSA
jgi:DNA invertase Pin-like site-specific DNA recombinase